MPWDFWLIFVVLGVILPWRGRPEPLKRGLIARVPPIDFEGFDE